MKRRFVLPVLLALLLCGCAAKEPTVPEAAVQAELARRLDDKGCLTYVLPEQLAAGEQVCLQYHWLLDGTGIGSSQLAYLTLGSGACDAALESRLIGLAPGEPLELPLEELTGEYPPTPGLTLRCKVLYAYRMELPELEEETFRILFGAGDLTQLRETIRRELAQAQEGAEQETDLRTELSAAADEAPLQPFAGQLQLPESELRRVAEKGYFDEPDEKDLLLSNPEGYGALYAALEELAREDEAFCAAYGGIYYEDAPVVLLTELSDELVQQVRGLAGGQQVRIRRCEHSLAVLQKAFDAVFDGLDPRDSLRDGVQSGWIDVRSNCVELGVWLGAERSAELWSFLDPALPLRIRMQTEPAQALAE